MGPRFGVHYEKKRRMPQTPDQTAPVTVGRLAEGDRRFANSANRGLGERLARAGKGLPVTCKCPLCVRNDGHRCSASDGEEN